MVARARAELATAYEEEREKQWVNVRRVADQTQDLDNLGILRYLQAIGELCATLSRENCLYGLRHILLAQTGVVRQRNPHLMMGAISSAHYNAARTRRIIASVTPRTFAYHNVFLTEKQRQLIAELQYAVEHNLVPEEARPPRLQYILARLADFTFPITANLIHQMDAFVDGRFDKILEKTEKVDNDFDHPQLQNPARLDFERPTGDGRHPLQALLSTANAADRAERELREWRAADGSRNYDAGSSSSESGLENGE